MIHPLGALVEPLGTTQSLRHPNAHEHARATVWPEQPPRPIPFRAVTRTAIPRQWPGCLDRTWLREVFTATVYREAIWRVLLLKVDT